MKKYFYIKGFVDRLLALILFICISPILLLAMLAIKIESPKEPIFYNAYRIGRYNKPFKMYKLRTMSTKFSGAYVPTKDTLSKVGIILRKTSIDELPQLVNILKGEMSFIGPRPLPQQYLEFYSVREIRRHEVFPGISGLAQVSGRINLPWDERFETDVQYVENMSLPLDLKILFLTAASIFKSETVALSADLKIFSEHRAAQMASGDFDPANLWINASPEGREYAQSAEITR